MTVDELITVLKQLFGTAVTESADNAWQIETSGSRLLVLLSDDRSWLRLLTPIVPAQEAEPFMEQLLTANFDHTQEVRYALHQSVLWGVFQHSRDGLTAEDLTSAVQRLLQLQQDGLTDSFNQLVEGRIRQIIQVAKRQGQSMEATLQTLERFYEEGVMGDLNSGAQTREQTLAAWRRQLERWWTEIEP